MTKSNDTAERRHWSQYWAGGALTSLPEDFPGNYDGEIAAFWNELFTSLPEDATLVDACAGNGALAFMAARYASDHEREFRIVAVDAAQIAPQRAIEAQPSLAPLVSRIEFIDRTPLEQWAWPEASVDLIVSQYGIEYCDQPVVAPRLAAVLKPGGRLAMLCHAVSSDMHATMQREAADYALVDESRVLRLIGSWLDGQLDSDGLRRGLARGAERLFAEFRASRSPLLGHVLGILKQIAAMDERTLRSNRDALAQAHRQLLGGKGRLDDMLRVNRLMADTEWQGPWLQAGLELEREGDLVYRGRHRVGRYHVFRRVRGDA